MINSGRYARVFWLLVLTALLSNLACNSEKRSAEASLDKFMKAQGVKTIDFGSFVTSPSVPDQAYLAAVATWNFADNKGNPQKEYIGAIMKKNGNDWSFQRFARYTDDASAAREILEGKKPTGH